MKRISILALLLAITVNSFADNKLEAGCFRFSKNTLITVNDDGLLPLSDYLSEFVHCPDRFPSNEIRLELDDEYSPGREDYRLEITEKMIRVTGSGIAGIFNGIQELFRNLPPSIYSRKGLHNCSVPVMTRTGSPAYLYRGVMIDVSRTWIDARSLKRQIDLMGFHRMNVLHLHLTDNEGWRIEIKSHPELTAAGAFRGGNSRLPARYGEWDSTYGGYYTQEEIKDIIRYAAQRNITVIPEIDLPGHSAATAAAIPDILCDYIPDLSKTSGLDLRDVWCPSDEKNYLLLNDILKEICSLFPSPYIHIGGDEVDVSSFTECRKCKTVMSARNYDDPRQLVAVFMHEVSDIIRKNGKTPLAWWDKFVQAGDTFRKGDIVCTTHDVETCRTAAREGKKIIFMPGYNLYFDMKQGAEEPGHNWGGIVDMDKVLKSSVVACGFNAQERANVIGYEGAFWTETYMSNDPSSDDYMDYMLYPRVAALEKICWEENPDYASAKNELVRNHYDRMSGMGIRFRLPYPVVCYSEGRITATVPDKGEIHYRKNKSKLRKYTGPIETMHPEEYFFLSSYRTGRSIEVQADVCHETLQPRFRMSTSFPVDSLKPVSNVTSYRGETRFSRSCRKGDWILFEFEDGVDCRAIKVHTGFDVIRNAGIPKGCVEVSYDGRHFIEVEELHDGIASIEPEAPVKSLKIISESEDNSWSYTVIQPLEIFPNLQDR